MNFLGGCSIPQCEEFQLDGCWIPAKPQNTPILARFNMMLDNPVENHPSLENWTQFVPNYDSLAQIFDTGLQKGQIPGKFGSGGNTMERSLATNNIPGPYQQCDWNNVPLMELLLGGDSSDYGITEKNAQSRDLRTAPERPLIPNQEQCGSVSFDSGFSYRSEFADLRTRNEIDWIGSTSQCGKILAKDDSPMRSEPIYDLNLPPTMNAAHLANDTNRLHFTPFESLEKRQSESRSISFEGTSHGKEILGNLAQCADGEIQQSFSQLLQNIVESSSTLVSTPAKETAISEKKGDLGIDLNETPQQKPPKRRKHRPKVIREGKLKRTPKPAVPKNPESNENRPGKRKYVRKKLPRDSEVEVIDLTGETTKSITASCSKACKRVLSFDLEEIDKNNLDIAVPQETSSGNRGNPDGTINHQSSHHTGERIVSTVQNEVPTGAESQMPNAGRSEIDGTTNQQQTGEACAVGIGKANLENLPQVDPTDLQRVKDLMRSTFQPIPKTPYKSSEQRGSKRNHSQTIQQARLSAKERTPPLSNGHTLHIGQGFDKKSRSRDSYRQTQNMSFNAIVAEGGLQKHNLNLMSRNLEQSYTALLNAQHNTIRLGERDVSDASKFTGEKFVQSIPAGQKSHAESMVSSSVHNPLIASLQVNSTAEGHFQMFQTNCFSTPEKIHMMGTHIQDKPTKRRGAKEKLNYISTPEKNRILGAHTQEKPVKGKGAKEKMSETTPLDEITYRLQILNLNGSSAGLQNSTNQNALVPYQGGGTLVPYQADMIKKRKPRPRVDLDSETNRIWNLLMGKEGSENVEATDEKKEKWWEEERKVFTGRVDSFIARMHLVQGDRRFSRWKGSVVDSVIGVFLTQNVSDHLSSSAFMSMAARFPLKPRTQVEVVTNVIDVEVPIATINPDEAIRWYEASSTSTSQNRVAQEPVQDQYGNNTLGTSKEAPIQSSEEEFILSQDSFNSSVTEVVGGIRSSSGSNSETEDLSIGCKPRNGQVSALPDILQREKSCSVQEAWSQVDRCTVFDGNSGYGEKNLSQTITETMRHLGSTSYTIPDNPDHINDSLTNHRISDIWLREPFSEECTSSWQSPPSTSAKGPGTVSKSSRPEKSVLSFDNSSREQSGPWRFQEPTTSPDAFLSIDFPNQPSFSVPIPSSVNNQSSWFSEHQKVNKTVSVKNNISIEPGNHTEALNMVQNSSKFAAMIVGAGDCISAADSHVPTKNNLVEVNSIENISPSSQHSTIAKTKNPKPRKVKAEDNKRNAVDWDDLRRKVKSSGKETERTQDSMDSLDYEAVRTANVKEISDTIKERGMNNMLAERMKEFLNRVVKDHGRIDLEWLRDVPPDKAKDYLLSIRGLGLKSVECVRLLTLHHLAFPVDTNVGRIAVRLGWVPLQPLPESLQLHLLELYPILESVQKYLWPRLCKLDQRTLYELHYQMITFGKVFCTKSKPNCNACPMRGECRHFASAFASARLALPGPEEKGIVSSTVPQTEDNNPVVIHPMALPAPPYSASSVGEVGSSNSKRCEPIIEEPASPEQECTEEVALSDIEDFEDPNEIPIIEVDIKEFAENLQSYMQNNMELQEADMSKALVALNPNMTHIPIPKLKNISRLRTEHQVYELPDSHPLLEQFDSREPDDPSPYLLAIWTPGETANSIQPPEKCCGSESDKLCNDPTCYSCSSVKESNSQTVRGTILVPCRTAMRGSFPLNGTYFQVNEMFADHKSSHNPIDVPRKWIWNLSRRTVYFGTSVSSIFKGLTTQGIQYCFWKGFVCVRGFEQETRAPRPLSSRLHFVASKLMKTKRDEKD